jgi:hypothetical protein
MTPTPPYQPRTQSSRPRSASPAERSVEFAETQERLKREAAERRALAAKKGSPTGPRTTGSRRTRG